MTDAARAVVSEYLAWMAEQAAGIHRPWCTAERMARQDAMSRAEQLWCQDELLGLIDTPDCREVVRRARGGTA